MSLPVDDAGPPTPVAKRRGVSPRQPAGTTPPPALAIAPEPVAPAPPRDAGRFASTVGFHDLLDAVAEIALSVAGGDPARARLVSKQRWDRQRLFLRRFDLPTAETIRQRLRATWQLTLDTALAPVADRVTVHNRLRAVSAVNPAVEDSLLIDDARALQCVAHRLGQSPSEIDYARAAREIDDDRKRKHEVLATRLPNSATILEHHAGKWDAALRAAGLERHRAPMKQVGRDPVEVLDLFFDTHDYVPVRSYVQQWASARGIRLQHRFYGAPFSELLREARIRRELRGLSTPTQIRRRSTSEQLPIRPKRIVYTDEDRMRSLRQYAAKYLKPGKPPRAKHYQSCCVGDPDLISINSIQIAGRFQDVCRRAGIV